MGNQNACPALDHALQSGTDAEFGFGVDARCGFVEDEDARIVGQGAGEVDELLLAVERKSRVHDGLVKALLEMSMNS